MRIEFLTPISGVMLGEKAAVFKDGRFYIDIALRGCAGHTVSVNGVMAEEHAGVYTLTLPLDGYESILTALDATTGETAVSTVYFVRGDSMKYRLSLDDNIWFFRNIVKHDYPSLFDDPYLSLMRDMNRKYGTKVHANLYYCCPEFGGFNLTQFPDKYRGEWEAASDWLRLSFHAFKNLPDKPYIDATYEQAFGECEMVSREIRRFAGEHSLSDYTTIHWCEGTPGACRAFRACGYKTLQGGAVDDGKTPITYYLSGNTFFDSIRKYGYYYDKSEDIIFSGSTLCLNKYSPKEIKTRLEQMTRDWPLCGFIDLVIHEQYFYPHYSAYLPDYRERVEAGISWCAAHGYTPSFRSEPLKH